MDKIRDNWDLIKKSIQDEYNITAISFRTWIEPLEYYKTVNNTVYIVIQSNQTQYFNYITTKFTSYFQVIISEMFDEEYEILFVFQKDTLSSDDDTNNKEETPKNASVGKQVDNETLNPKYTFDTFVVGSNNKLAHSACLAVAETPGEVYNPLYIYGGPGLGKTHLMHSIGHFILEQNPNMKVLYVTSEDFTNEVIESIRSGNATSMTKLREKYRTVDVLMVDDVQFIIGKDSTQEEFFHTFNALHEANKQIVISSDKPPKEIQTLDERFRSRFSWGLTVDVQAPDYETRMAILLKNSENSGISEEIIEYIATNIKSNIRELEGALNKIIAFAKLNNAAPTMALAEEALKDMISTSKSSKTNPDSIITIVAESFGVKSDDITSQKRNADFVLPRQVVMYLCYNILSLSYQNIAKILGKKDHTTIMHGVDKITEEIKTDSELNHKIELIRKKLV